MEQRLSILLNGGVINKEVFDGMLRVIHTLESEFKIMIRHPQGEMALTHMASALMRSYRGETIEPIAADILDEVILDENFLSIQAIHNKLLSFFDFPINKAEEGYLLCNLYSLKLITE